MSNEIMLIALAAPELLPPRVLQRAQALAHALHGMREQTA